MIRHQLTLLSPGGGVPGRSALPAVRAAGRALVDVLYPPTCLSCGQCEDLDANRICGDCCVVLQDAGRKPYCPRCGHNAPPYGVLVGRCRICRRRRLAVEGIVRVGAYDRLLRELITTYKFGQRSEIEQLLARLLADALRQAPWFGQIEGLAVVPTCWRHQLGRRYYAAGAIATRMARLAGLPLMPLLHRTAAGRPQYAVKMEERVKNVRGKFALTRGVRLDRANVCLIDDITTSGATLAECAKALTQGGAARVYAAVVAKAAAEPRR